MDTGILLEPDFARGATSVVVRVALVIGGVYHRRHRAVVARGFVTVEGADEGRSVSHIRLGSQRGHHGEDLLARRFVQKRITLQQYRHPLGAVEGLAIDTAWPDSASYRPSCSKAGRRPRRRARSRGATREGVA